MNVIKANKRSLLTNESLDDHILLATDGAPLKEFCSDAAIDLWWRDKLHRPNQRKRKKYKKCTSIKRPAVESSSSQSESEESDVKIDMLTEWENWMTPP